MLPSRAQRGTFHLSPKRYAACAGRATCRRHCIKGWMRSPKVAVPLTSSSKVSSTPASPGYRRHLVEQARHRGRRADQQAHADVDHRARIDGLAHAAAARCILVGCRLLDHPGQRLEIGALPVELDRTRPFPRGHAGSARIPSHNGNDQGERGPSRLHKAGSLGPIDRLRLDHQRRVILPGCLRGARTAASPITRHVFCDGSGTGIFQGPVFRPIRTGVSHGAQIF